MTITSVLVANRGEIVRRVFRSARSMGMRCVAVYVGSDAASPFVSEADEAIRLKDSYLDGDAIIAAALATGAQAIHPGYGFLAEDSTFAADVLAAGLIWVGPPPQVIATMGDKLAAKAVAIDAKVSTLESTTEIEHAAVVGFPLLVKAAAGGGGKGMRIVASPDELEEAVASARREAGAAFGNDTVFFERYISRSHHIEVQILGDSHGHVIHLGERECSIQRRHQKIIEETPSINLDKSHREALTDAAVRLAHAIGYTSTGTVEFLVDAETKDFFFLEVNTRLQVEHAVTEEVTGIDLVREQLRIAAEEPLGYAQHHVTFTGHSIEARLYAEDPTNEFLPAIGTLDAYRTPADPQVRWDNGIEASSVVGVDFDPMLAKAVSHAPTRTEAAGKLALALERLHIGGVTTNRDFLSATLRHPSFLAGDTTTDFIDRHAPDRRRQLSQTELARNCVGAAMWLQAYNRAAATVLDQLPSGFRNSRLPPQRSVFRVDDRDIAVEYRSNRDASFAVEVGGLTGSATVHRWSPEMLDLEWCDLRTRFQVTSTQDVIHLTAAGGTTSLAVIPRFKPPDIEATSAGMLAPMPGVVLEVRVTPGHAVSKGQTLVVLEAMKMEHHMDAPAAGVVAEVRVIQGQQVDTGEMLIVFEQDPAPTSEVDHE